MKSVFHPRYEHAAILVSCFIIHVRMQSDEDVELLHNKTSIMKDS